MDTVVNYIVNNYIWFIVGLVVLTMVIIGYIADKTDFGHKKKKDKDIKQEPQVQETNLDELKNKTLNDILAPNVQELNPSVEDLNAPLVNNNINDMQNEDLNVPFGTSVSTIEVSTPSASLEDLSVPLEDNNFNNEVSVDTGSDDLNVPLIDASDEIPSLADIKPVADVKQFDYEEPVVPEVITEKMNSSLSSSAPLRIEPENVEPEPTEVEEDIWKF